MTHQIERKLTLVLMAGLPGTGKTTLATELGRELQWPVLNKDMLKLSLLQLGIEYHQAGRMTYDLIFKFAEDVLVRQQLSVILDTSAHHPFILENASRIAGVAHAQLKVVLCTATIAIRKLRHEQRSPNELSSHHAEFLLIEDDLQFFTHLLCMDPLILDTINPLEECLAKAIAYLMKEEAE